MKLHLGCGETYLQGYVNVDYPPMEHTVMDTSIADIHADILGLQYPVASIEEVRLHHVFEHFTRPIACALLASWFSWLEPGGLLRLGVPDFQRTARILLRRFTSRNARIMAERHLYGSHEADWAIHCAGYTSESLSYLLDRYGFRVKKVDRTHYRSIHNFEVFAYKHQQGLKRNDFRRITEEYLRNALVDKSRSERHLLEVWLNIYDRQVDSCWAVGKQV